MNGFLDFAVYTLYVALLLWAVAAISRRVDRRYEQPVEKR